MQLGEYELVEGGRQGFFTRREDETKNLEETKINQGNGKGKTSLGKKHKENILWDKNMQTK